MASGAWPHAGWAFVSGSGHRLGALRGVMAEGGLRGPWASAMFTVVRLTADQTQESITGVGRRRGPGLVRSPCGSKPAATTPTPASSAVTLEVGDPLAPSGRSGYFDHYLTARTS